MSQRFLYHSEVFFDEMDALGVLHHTRYLLHLERAQQKFFEQLLGVNDFNTDRDEDIYVVVHSLDTRFREPFEKPGPIVVDYGVERIRSSGVTMDFVIRDLEGKHLYCEGKRTVCKLSSETHQPTLWTEPFRAALEEYLK
ncbi:MAG TPA: thioesterase family protein [Phaeodactylibacter sp.]|nr:thioesterase family protein [Phaeodactylibacter sp.]